MEIQCSDEGDPQDLTTVKSSCEVIYGSHFFITLFVSLFYQGKVSTILLIVLRVCTWISTVCLIFSSYNLSHHSSAGKGVFFFNVWTSIGKFHISYCLQTFISERVEILLQLIHQPLHFVCEYTELGTFIDAVLHGLCLKITHSMYWYFFLIYSEN